MPIIKSAKKALRSSGRKRVYNLRRKYDLADAEKKLKKLVVAKKAGEARTYLSTIYKLIDKAAKTKYIKKNTASRKKSRLSKLIKIASGK